MKEYDRTYAEIDLGAIRHNIKETRKHIKPGTKIMAIVKANAYGHGVLEVTNALEDLVDAYGVAMVEEALELRRAGLDKMVLILGYTGEDWFPELIENQISQTVYTWEMAEQLNCAAAKLGMKARIHIKVDTGMSRIGFLPTDENIKMIERIAELPCIEIEGIYTHFARADERTIEAARIPFQIYMEFVRKLETAGISIPVKHVANSASIIQFPEANLDMVRSGISTYGLYPSEEVPKDILKLHPAMQWKAKISYVKTIEKGTAVSYGGTYIAEKEMRVATVPVGYADGMKRDLSNKGRVLVHGKPANILGRICMDQFMIDVTDIPETKAGDMVTIFGEDGDNQIPVEEIAALSHSFNYEFVCGITGRVPRLYKNK